MLNHYESQRTTKFHFNRIHTTFEVLLRRPAPTNIPMFCVHEPTTGCNLRCPACPTGAGVTNVKETATIEDYDFVCKELGKYLEVYYLFSWGEPTASRHLTAVLKRLKSELFSIHMSSNFSIPLKDDLLEAFATTPQLSLQIDVDGSTQATHEKSRVKSNLSVVLDNAKRLSDRIKQSATPPFEVFFGFLEFGYNADEREAVKRMASELGFKFASLGKPLFSERAPEEKNITLNPAIGCTWLYTSIAPTPGLSHVAPCCGVWDENMMSKRAADEPLHQMFTHDSRYKARRGGDAAFARLPMEARIAALQKNISLEKGMGLLQAESSDDICGRCAMGNSYQAKLPRVLSGAIKSLAHLKAIPLKAAQDQLNLVWNKIVPGAHHDEALKWRLISTLDMPLASERTIAAYRQFDRFLADMA